MQHRRLTMCDTQGSFQKRVTSCQVIFVACLLHTFLEGCSGLHTDMLSPRFTRYMQEFCREVYLDLSCTLQKTSRLVIDLAATQRMGINLRSFLSYSRAVYLAFSAIHILLHHLLHFAQVYGATLLHLVHLRLEYTLHRWTKVCVSFRIRLVRLFYTITMIIIINNYYYYF